MTNTNCLDGLQCPTCKSFEPFEIEVKTTMKVFDNGTGHHRDTEWDEASYCECCECGFSATVANFNKTYSGTKAESAPNLLETLRQGVKIAGEVVSRWEQGDLAESVRALGVWHAEAEATVAEGNPAVGGQHG